MCGGGKGGGSTTTTTNTNSTASQSPPPYLDSAYQNLVSNAQSLAAQPLQVYQGNTIAPFSTAQTGAFGEVANAQGAANPYINAAANSINASQTPLWSNTLQYSPQNLQSFENPYQSDVINSTMAQIGQLDAQQQSQLQGNAISSHALGGDRAGIAAASLANQQGLAAGQTLSQLNAQNFTQANQELNTQQQAQLGANEAQSWLNSQAGFGYGNLGNEALNTQLTGAQAELSTGNQQQAQLQAELNYPYEVYQQQQAYPYQDIQYLSNILEGIGGVAGGTSTGSSSGSTTTSQPAPSLLSQILGGVAGGVGILGQTGAFGNNGYLTNFFGAPQATAPTNDFSSFAANFGGLGSLGASQSAANNFTGGLSPNPFGITYNRGGLVPRRHLASGGGAGSADPGLDAMPDFSLSFIPNSPPSGVHANFPQLPQPQQPQQQQGGGGGGGGGIGDIIGPIATIASFFNKGGLVSSRRAFGGQAGGASGMPGRTVSLAKHFQPKPPSGGLKGANWLKPIKFDDGGGVGGLMPSAASMNPVTQGNYQRYSQYPTEKLQELAARARVQPGGQQQAGLIQKALSQKQLMPNTATPAATAAQTTAPQGLQVPQILTNQSGFARGGVSHETRQHFDPGGSVDRGIYIPYPPPSNDIDADLPADIAAQDVARNAVPAGGLAPPIPASTSSNSYGISAPPISHHEPLEPAQHYTAPEGEKPDPWNAMAQAGFAIMAGKSPNALQNIGEGLLHGSKAYAKERNDASERSYRQGQIGDAVNRLNMEADNHRDTINMEQEKLDQRSIVDANEAAYKQAQIENMHAERQKPIPDGFGGFLIPNPKDPAHPLTMDVTSGAGTPDADGKIKPSIQNLYNHPKDKDGNPLKGDEFYATLPPAVAAQAKSYQSGNSAPPTGFATKPVLLAAYQAAQDGDDSFRRTAGTRFQTIKDFTNPNGKTGQTVKSQNVTMEHISTLRDAVDALNNKDVPAFNAAANMIAKQTGQPEPNNFELGQQLVSDEIAKAVLGTAGASVDREGIKKSLNVNASHDQAYGALDQAGQYMAGQAAGLEQSYRAGTELPNYRDRFLTPPAKALIDKYYPLDDKGVPQQKSSGKDKAAAAPQFPNAPPVGTVKMGFQFNGGDPASSTNWSKVPQ